MKKSDKNPNPGGRAEERFAPAAIARIRDEIDFCAGNEVFFAGKVNEEGLVADVEPFARGNDQAVPVLMEAVSSGDVVIHNHPTGFLVPSEADIAVASRLGNDGVGCYIVDNDVSRVYAVVEPEKMGPKCQALDPEEIAGLLGEDGPLAAAHSQYEVRPSQCRMAAQVARVLDTGSVGIIEAGTGTGKSLAYLIPALKWALAGDRRVVVSTNTINLQEQHLQKDLPLVEKVIQQPINAVLIKGRGNYLCLRKRDLLDTDTGDVLLDFDDVREMQSLLEWSRNTSDGSLSDLSFVPEDPNWSLIRSESDSCLRARCAHFSSCFYFRMRRRAASAQVLFANHHVLFADLSLRSSGQESSSIMPKYDAVILDEAHNVEGVALSYFDSSFGRWGATSAIGRLVSRRNREKGLIPFLLKKVRSARGLSSGRREKLVKKATDVFDGIQERRARLESAFEELAALFTLWLGTEGSSQDRWRITIDKRREKQWKKACELLNEIWEILNDVLIPLRNLNRYLRDLMEDGHEELAGQWTDTGAVVGRLESSLDFINRAVSGNEEDEVFWAQVRGGKRPAVTLHLTPLDAAGLMESNLFSVVGPIVLTSATLTVGGTFQFLKKRLGIDLLESDRVLEQVFASPFDFGSQMRIALPEDVPDPGKEGYLAGLADVITQMVAASEGNSLVLFTSYRTLNSVYESCAAQFNDPQISFMKQGQAPRTVLLERFRQNRGSVLFATDSFWEGVDVVGESLSNLIVARLPFPVPTDPVTEARSEAIHMDGGDPFMEDSLPRAVIRLRQGVGRLIRHRNDKGFAVICDGRVLRRFYGRIFLDSLPPAERVSGRTEKIADLMSDFLAK